jgi:hypothetical protein
MLARQIGAVTEGERLMNALGTSNNPANLNTAPPVDQNGVPLSDNATPTAMAPPLPPSTTGFENPLLWAGIGLGTALLLTSTSDGHTMAGTKKKDMLIPLLIVGGAAAAWWFFSKPAATTPGVTTPGVTSPGTPVTPVDNAATVQRNYVNAWASSDNSSSGPGRVAAAARMSDADIATLYTILHDYFSPGTPLTTGLQTAFSQISAKYPGIGG